MFGLGLFENFGLLVFKLGRGDGVTLSEAPDGVTLSFANDGVKTFLIAPSTPGFFTGAISRPVLFSGYLLSSSTVSFLGLNSMPKSANGL